MIGDQLIKNEKIALIELIKNSYDADASWVQVRFMNFAEEKGELVQYTGSFIEIEDDGEGMTFDTIENSWMNPASPNKYLQKEKGKIRTTKKRIIQGEKGIGRYAIYKIGSTIELITRSLASNSEIVLTNDLSIYDEEIIRAKGKTSGDPAFLDEIKFRFEVRTPKSIVEKEITVRDNTTKREPHGTVITIRNLKSTWSKAKIDEVMVDIARLNFPFGDEDVSADFLWDFQIDGKPILPEQTEKAKFELLFERAPLRITDGKYDNRVRAYKFDLNGKELELSLERMRSNKEFRNHFCDQNGKIKRKPDCGSFGFKFYVFDRTSQAALKYHLDEEERDFVKSHRIYLYRDGIRVYPYGDPSDDWLGIDVLRGTGRAGDYLSNDQTIGYISISGGGNPYLKDKTSREGLLEIGNAFLDFKVLIQSFLGYLHTEYRKYKLSTKALQTIFSVKESALLKDFEVLISHLDDVKDSKGKKLASSLMNEYRQEREYLKTRAETTEDLAAVGLTVEAASHDLMMMMNRAKDTLEYVIKLVMTGHYDREKLENYLERLRGQLDFIALNIEGIQPIFRSSKRGIKSLDVRQAILDVRKYYDDLLQKNSITFSTELVGSNLKVRTTEAVLLQTFINLLDNSVYWLTTIDKKGKDIRARINADKQEVVFADNGPGVDDDNIPYIFEPFFSTKGIEGRGLGLYIAKQLLERNDYHITYSNSKKILSGANFIISFNKEE